MTINLNQSDRSEESLTHKDSNCPYIPIGHHRFFIPVMGTGFTIDTPLRVAKFGISSVISIGDDMLIEQVREYYSKLFQRPYQPIARREDDARARRIRAYLSLVHDVVQDQIDTVRTGPFEPGSDITKYFELLPSGSLRSEYDAMLACSSPETKLELQAALRPKIVAGQIDANIMTKIDRELVQKDGKGIPESGVAMSALRGFATSSLNSSIVLSAGINKRLFAYMAQFEDFYPSASKPPKKTIILKVSDYRSAQLQGTLLAKRGLWVSEYRIESGLNCGGHAFATKGELMGPVLEEFRSKRVSLVAKLRKYYSEALEKMGRTCYSTPSIVLSAQGGVGTSAEHRFLCDQYDVDRVGWGTPFLLVPEATNVDDVQLEKLIAADEDDVELSGASPLGIPFWLLKNTTSDEGRRQRIAQGTPGSSCPKNYLASDTELSVAPLCRASKKYQKLKLDELNRSSLPAEEKQAAISAVHARTCLCGDLAGGVLNRLNLAPGSRTAVCSGLSIADFDRIYSLNEMVDHIYGRQPVELSSVRPNMFIRELSLYVAYFQDLVTKKQLKAVAITDRYCDDFTSGLLSGIRYYRQLPSRLEGDEKNVFLTSLTDIENQFLALAPDTPDSRIDPSGAGCEATPKGQPAKPL